MPMSPRPTNSSRPPISNPPPKRFVRWFTISLLLLTGCGSRSDSGSTAGKAESTPALPPAATSIPQTVSAPPVPEDSTVSWAELAATIRGNPDAIRAVQQTHSLRVTAVFKDGHRYHATEPQIDAILKLVREVDPAGQILIATE
jgi:hypothetical protein